MKTKYYFLVCKFIFEFLSAASEGNISIGDGQGWEANKHIDGNKPEWDKHLNKLQNKFKPEYYRY